LKGLIPVDSGLFETVLDRVNRASLKGLDFWIDSIDCETRLQNSTEL
jgi:hypothetical protein